MSSAESKMLSTDSEPVEEIKSEAILGFRCWYIENGKLQAAATGTIWRAGLNIAYCHSNSHMPPSRHCDCGLNSFFSLPLQEDVERTNHNYIWGAIAGSGEAQVHKLGARVQEAVPIALFAPQNFKGETERVYEERILELREFYKIPIFKNRDRFLSFCNKYAKKEFAPAPSRYQVNKAVGSEVITSPNIIKTTRTSNSTVSSAANFVIPGLFLIAVAFFTLFAITLIGYLNYPDTEVASTEPLSKIEEQKDNLDDLIYWQRETKRRKAYLEKSSNKHIKILDNQIAKTNKEIALTKEKIKELKQSEPAAQSNR